MEYSDAGVDIAAADNLIKDVKSVIANTNNKNVIGGIGQFAALYELPINEFKNPVLVSATDGVGTKLKLAAKLNDYSSIGIDLVAMCVNDIAVMGAKPLFFLDYYATSKLDQIQAKSVINSIATGCNIANISLIGGETAEMPNLYQGNDFDLAGFCVGCINKTDIVDINTIKDNDVLIGISSNGLHSNGYSLVNYLIEKRKINLEKQYLNTTYAKELLKPTKIYSNLLYGLYSKKLIKSAAHITGGGLVENIPRVLPDSCIARINPKIWYIPEIFKVLQKLADMQTIELYKTFNCGIGLVLVVDPNKVSTVLSEIGVQNEKAFVIGNVVNSKASSSKVCFI